MIRRGLPPVFPVGAQETIREPLGEVGKQQGGLRRQPLLAARAPEDLHDLFDRGQRVDVLVIGRWEVATGEGPVREGVPRSIGTHRTEGVRPRLGSGNRLVDQEPVDARLPEAAALYRVPQPRKVGEQGELQPIPKPVPGGAALCHSWNTPLLRLRAGQAPSPISNRSGNGPP